MYSLDINFLNDPSRSGVQTATAGTQTAAAAPGSQVPMFIGIGVGVLALGLVGGGYMLMNNRVQELTAKKTQLTTEMEDLKKKLGEVATINDQIAAIDKQTGDLTAIFNDIRSWSAVLTDIRDRVPAKVQLNSVTQTAEAGGGPSNKLSIAGQAKTFDDVNDFILLLRQSPFLDAEKVILVSSTLKEQQSNRPGVLPTNLVEYQIEAPFNQKPAADPEILSALERKGAVGVVTRIQELKNKGVIQ